MRVNPYEAPRLGADGGDAARPRCERIRSRPAIIIVAAAVGAFIGTALDPVYPVGRGIGGLMGLLFGMLLVSALRAGDNARATKKV